MKIGASPNVDRTDDPNVWTAQALDEIINVVNGNLGFDNLAVQIISASFSTANSDVTISHSLRRVPTFYIQLGQNAAMNLYDGATPFNASAIYLRSSAVGSARILVG